MSVERSAWSDEVARYYDRNTARFVLVGRGREAHAMHRELWAPGVASARRAVEHVNEVLVDEIRDVAPVTAPVVLDFGCGVGGTLFHLARKMPGAQLSGITVSRRQVDIARRLAAESDLAGRCSFVLGDFQSARLSESADVVLAVESFVHSESADAFLANAARNLAPGGHLIVVDDFLGAEPIDLSARRRRLVEQFRVGWRVPAVCTVEGLVAAGARHGLESVKAVDLTGLTRPGSRVRDRLVAAVSPLLARLGLARMPFYGNMIGGNALQIGLREGFLHYQLVVLRRSA